MTPESPELESAPTLPASALLAAARVPLALVTLEDDRVTANAGFEALVAEAGWPRSAAELLAELAGSDGAWSGGGEEPTRVARAVGGVERELSIQPVAGSVGYLIEVLPTPASGVGPGNAVAASADGLEQAVAALAAAIDAASADDGTLAAPSDPRLAPLADRAAALLADARTTRAELDRTRAAVAEQGAELAAAGGALEEHLGGTRDRTTDAALAVGELSANVSGVATAAEELGASIGEISANASEATTVAGEAVEVASRANETISRLGQSGEQIGRFSRVIAGIAQQTNLLALNATIEAARAGEAGRGFAVVAHEVKSLAGEAGRATDDIGRQIEAVQRDTTAAVEAIVTISEVIDRIHQLQTSIAGAVEQQSQTANEIGRNANEAADRGSRLDGLITDMAESVERLAQHTEVTGRAVRALEGLVGGAGVPAGGTAEENR
jgi:methyl-accepting chemotaxis protein